MSRRLEIVSGVLAGLAGIVGISVFLFAPIGGTNSNSGSGFCDVLGHCARTSSTATHHAQTGIQTGLGSATLVLLVVLVVSLTGVVVGAYLHGRSRLAFGRPILVASTALLTGGAVASDYAGLFVLPAVVLAVVALSADVLSGRAPAGFESR